MEEVIVAETFLVDYATENGTTVVRFIGELDMEDARRAEEAGIAALSRLDSDRSPLVIDVSELAFCDSSGLHALLAIRNEAEAAGHPVTLRRPSAILRRTLELTDLCRAFALDRSQP
jgi:anti-sigma B factor antagonist